MPIIRSLPAIQAARIFYCAFGKRFFAFDISCGQYFAHLLEKLNLSPAEMNAYLMKHSINNVEHAKLCADAEVDDVENAPQMDLFSLLSLPLAA